jgi:hypothetical protein
MRVTDFAKGVAWAIVPDRFEMLAAIARDFSPEKMGEKVVTIGEKWDERKLYTVNDEGIATIEINGPLAKNLDFWDRVIFGMVDYLDVKRRSASVAARRSSGWCCRSFPGAVNGVGKQRQRCSMRGTKPIIAFSSGCRVGGVPDRGGGIG